MNYSAGRHELLPGNIFNRSIDKVNNRLVTFLLHYCLDKKKKKFPSEIFNLDPCNSYDHK